ncbi:Protein of unknown function [Bacillus cytotoxicus]|uniref:Uncharacterized protein n=1 Tax=Bacillus cytotoxicus TaxID=580165 RepID=A0AAX2CP48_9BACI|nr:Protein of unknown function [Bacillus cytotoxicus]
MSDKKWIALVWTMWLLSMSSMWWLE